MKLAGFYLISILMTQMNFVWGDSSESEYLRQTPQQVSMEAQPGGSDRAIITGYFNFSNSCEKDGYYEYEVRDQEIVIDSYKEVQKNGICFQKSPTKASVEFEVKGLQDGELYHVYFLDEKGEPQFVGDLSTDQDRLSEKTLY